MTTYHTRTAQTTQEWQARVEQQIQARRVAIGAFLGRHLLPASTQAVGDDTLLHGLLWQHDEVPGGWRWHRTRPGIITPDQSTPAGQEIACQLGEIPHVAENLLLPGGMPASAVRAESQTLMWPHVELYQQRLWVVWPSPLSLIDQRRVDLRVWQEHTS
ncbi:hypothetical protein [Nocardiopsis synnemataformans]|uniref:hypothetical protein n=1 Tax=Nocardiopsis synnemataformans TaxID=61305 RepID=UPI003EB698E1